ncbi:MAG TPA: hypothetical protein PLE19_20505 [Planctomycetota bacterium]|nr:hypothetical protein [Planctomycetota bacterium]HRR81864.1 hypothetical protein [Planctomycetota bacterium]HRT97667.1 hypothetical protein [Planctomycetota bacterium]
MLVICPSCAASNYCPEMAAGLTVCCRKCKTQVTLPDASNRPPPPWYATRYWLVAAGAALAALGGLALCLVWLSAARPPKNLPLLRDTDVVGAPVLAVPGSPLRFRWQTDLESVGGFFAVEGHTVTLTDMGQLDARDVAVRQRGWTHEVFRPGSTLEARPIVPEFRILLPEDEMLEGQTVTLKVIANLEYPARTQPDGPVSLQRRSVAREWTFAVATRPEAAAFRGYLRLCALLRAGVVFFAALVLMVGLAAGLLAHRTLNIQCPECGRVTLASYYPGGRKLHWSPCPHKGSRPVKSRRG